MVKEVTSYDGFFQEVVQVGNDLIDGLAVRWLVAVAKSVVLSSLGSVTETICTKNSLKATESSGFGVHGVDLYITKLRNSETPHHDIQYLSSSEHIPLIPSFECFTQRLKIHTLKFIMPPVPGQKCVLITGYVHMFYGAAAISQYQTLNGHP